MSSRTPKIKTVHPDFLCAASRPIYNLYLSCRSPASPAETTSGHAELDLRNHTTVQMMSLFSVQVLANASLSHWCNNLNEDSPSLSVISFSSCFQLKNGGLTVGSWAEENRWLFYFWSQSEADSCVHLWHLHANNSHQTAEEFNLLQESEMRGWNLHRLPSVGVLCTAWQQRSEPRHAQRQQILMER